MLPYHTLLPVDRSLSLPLYQQVSHAMVQHIRSGVLKPGLSLPGTRELAGLLQLHRKTIIAAYEELSAQGWIDVIPKKGFHVAGNLPEVRPRPWQKKEGSNAFSKSMKASFYPGPRTAFQVPEPIVPPPRLIIDDGHPDMRLAPLDLLAREYRVRLKSGATRKQVTASLTPGSSRLRETLVTFLAETRGVQAQVSNILVTHGAQMSIYIAASLLVRPGDQVIVGEPGYPAANGVFESLGAVLRRVPVDENGIDTDKVEKMCRTHPVKMLYLVPHHHHPTTVTLSPDRRMRLLEIADRHNFAIVEDDYDYDFHYSSSPYLPLAAGGHNNRLIYISSFSKALSSSIRVGFMVAPEDFITQAIYLRRLIELRGDPVMEDALAALIRNGDVGRHLKKVNRIYAARRDHLCLLLDTLLKGKVAYRKPSGGMVIWTCFDKRYPLQRIAERAAREGLYMSSGEMYKDYNAIRFGFASLTEEELEEAVKILSRCC